MAIPASSIKKGFAAALIAGAIVLTTVVGTPVPPSDPLWDDQCFRHDVASLNVAMWKPGATANMVTLYPKTPGGGTAGETFYGPSPEFLTIHPRLQQGPKVPGAKWDLRPTDKWVSPQLGVVVECHNVRDGGNVPLPPITVNLFNPPPPPPVPDPCNTPGGVGCPP